MKKIMFSDAFQLTQAVLDLIKTKTRRVISNKLWEKWDKVKHPESTEEDMIQFFLDNSPYKVGEVVAVAQSYKDCGYDANALDRSPKDLNVVRGTLGESKGWNNKMFTAADILPHRIRITDVRVERLNDISEDDCLAEGVELNPRQYEFDGQKIYFVRNLGHWRSFGCDNFITPREAYAALIDKISGKGTWESNPYVFVYTFELVK